MSGKSLRHTASMRVSCLAYNLTKRSIEWPVAGEAKYQVERTTHLLMSFYFWDCIKLRNQQDLNETMIVQVEQSFLQSTTN